MSPVTDTGGSECPHALQGTAKEASPRAGSNRPPRSAPSAKPIVRKSTATTKTRRQGARFRRDSRAARGVLPETGTNTSPAPPARRAASPRKASSCGLEGENQRCPTCRSRLHSARERHAGAPSDNCRQPAGRVAPRRFRDTVAEGPPTAYHDAPPSHRCATGSLRSPPAEIRTRWTPFDLDEEVGARPSSRAVAGGDLSRSVGGDGARDLVGGEAAGREPGLGSEVTNHLLERPLPLEAAPGSSSRAPRPQPPPALIGHCAQDLPAGPVRPSPRARSRQHGGEAPVGESLVECRARARLASGDKLSADASNRIGESRTELAQLPAGRNCEARRSTRTTPAEASIRFVSSISGMAAGPLRWLGDDGARPVPAGAGKGVHDRGEQVRDVVLLRAGQAGRTGEARHGETASATRRGLRRQASPWPYTPHFAGRDALAARRPVGAAGDERMAPGAQACRATMVRARPRLMSDLDGLAHEPRALSPGNRQARRAAPQARGSSDHARELAQSRVFL